MALKTLMLRKRLTDAKKELEAVRANDEAFVTREAELETSISEVNTEEERDAVSEAIDSFEAEKTEHEDKKADLERQVADLEAELQEEEKEQDVPQAPAEERKEISTMEVRESKEYLHAYANYMRETLRTGHASDAELRSLLTENASGYVPVPTYVEAKIRHAWEKNGLMDLIRKTYVKGNLKIAYEVSATGAVAHTEGAAAVEEEDLVLRIVNLIPVTYKKWVSFSTEVLDMNMGLDSDEGFLDYIYDEIADKITLTEINTLVYNIANNNLQGITVATVPVASLGLDTVAKLIARLSDEATNPVLVMNRGTWAEFKALQYGANYSVDPFEGLPIYFSSAIPTFANAQSDEGFLVVGDFANGAQANFPSGSGIKFVLDEYTSAPADIVKLIGRQYVAMGVVAPGAFAMAYKDEE